ncbi:alpha-latrotoxin-Lhe1a-like [Vigna umbellata]|uniref:alpha-latrotoxin-Lhe1a-like n=1 Tax=Vigna umbellata TaxID=87088 RepID=UPI001F5F303C|nr:alpha-latrotoxin-Lhe1a-like [Vigna umbellata]
MGDALMVEREDGGASEHTQKTSKLLFKLCMKGEWEEVERTFEKDKKAHTAKITKTGDTALHVAVTDGQDDVVGKLVKLICSETEEGKRKEALGIQNKRKNTALHLAASMGSVEMCKYIASAEASLLSMRNVDGETPLFLAALHGRKEVFLFLHYFSNNNHPEPLDYYSNCARTNDDTILHSAIAGDYFDLAFQIIHLYGDLVNSVNQSGLTPLHLLANKPSVFRSGGHLGRFERIVYNAIMVKKLKVARSSQERRPTNTEKISYPENYEICAGLLSMAKKFALMVTEPLRQFLKKDNDEIGKERDLEASKNIATDDGAETKSAGED